MKIRFEKSEKPDPGAWWVFKTPADRMFYASWQIAEPDEAVYTTDKPIPLLRSFLKEFK